MMKPTQSIMGKKTNFSKVNAGSMADIAFLILIFFLVTTTIHSDSGIDRLLPKLQDESEIGLVQEKNILRVMINEEGDLLVDGQITALDELKETVKGFLDNGGLTKLDPEYCGYCLGDRSITSSDNPSRAIVVLSYDKKAYYSSYISVQDKLMAAYNELRNREAQRLYGEDYTVLETKFVQPGTSDDSKILIKAKIESIRALYPLKLSEIETN